MFDACIDSRTIVEYELKWFMVKHVPIVVVAEVVLESVAAASKDEAFALYFLQQLLHLNSIIITRLFLISLQLNQLEATVEVQLELLPRR